MYAYLETLPQWLENTAIIFFLFISILIVFASIVFTAKIVKKIREIKFKLSVGKAEVKADIKIEAPTTTAEIKPQSEGA